VWDVGCGVLAYKSKVASSYLSSSHNQQPTPNNQQPTTNNPQPTTNNPHPTTHVRKRLFLCITLEKAGALIINLIKPGKGQTVRKSILFIICFLIILFIFLNSAYAGTGYTNFWVKVLDVYHRPVSTAQVVARNTSSGTYYTLMFMGWGYYNRTLVPGTYDIIVNGRLMRKSVYASAYWYVMVTCYI
jgi:hypothetical protein